MSSEESGETCKEVKGEGWGGQKRVAEPKTAHNMCECSTEQPDLTFQVLMRL